MSDHSEPHDESRQVGEAEESPEQVPPKAWVTMLLFAGFVIAFGSCASMFMFN